MSQVDYNGGFEYSEIKRAVTGIELESNKITAFPTVIKTGMIKLSSSQPTVIKSVILKSISGKTVENLTRTLNQRNMLNYEINLKDKSKGVYLLRIDILIEISILQKS